MILPASGAIPTDAALFRVERVEREGGPGRSGAGKGAVLAGCVEARFRVGGRPERPPAKEAWRRSRSAGYRSWLASGPAKGLLFSPQE